MTLIAPHLRRRIHSIVGLAGIAAFIASGVEMRWWYRHLEGFDRATHLSFRSIHIYLLMSSLLNIALARWHATSGRRWAEIVASLGTAFAAAAPILLATAFIREPLVESLDRPLTRLGVICCAAAVLLLSISRKGYDRLERR